MSPQLIIDHRPLVGNDGGWRTPPAFAAGGLVTLVLTIGLLAWPSRLRSQKGLDRLLYAWSRSWLLVTGARVEIERTDHVNEVGSRVLCGSGTFNVTGFIETLQQIGFAGPWGVEIISTAHRRRPLSEAMVDVHRTTMAMFDNLAVDVTHEGH